MRNKIIISIIIISLIGYFTNPSLSDAKKEFELDNQISRKLSENITKDKTLSKVLGSLISLGIDKWSGLEFQVCKIDYLVFSTFHIVIHETGKGRYQRMNFAIGLFNYIVPFSDGPLEEIPTNPFGGSCLRVSP